MSTNSQIHPLDNVCKITDIGAFIKCFTLQFTDDLTIAVTSDSGGSVFELEFKWV